MDRKIIAAILAGALTLGTAAALAADAPTQETADRGTGEISVPEETIQPAAAPEGEAPDASAPAQTEEPAPQPEAPEPPALPEPDAVGTVSFANLETRLRENNFTVRAFGENIAALESIDYEKMAEDMRKSINSIAKAQWSTITMGSQFPNLTPGEHIAISIAGSSANASLQATYDSLRDTFDDLKKGEIQEDNAAVIRQLENAQDQLVMASESLYIALAELEQSDASLGRQLTALDRQIQELELRYDLGQISALALEQAKGGRTALVSGRDTLRMNMTNYKLQLEQMIGAELTGEIQLQALPGVKGEDLAAMDLEADLAAAKERSYTLFSAQRTLDDAREDYWDTPGAPTSYKRVAAEHTWQAAQYTYTASVEGFENSFRTLYNQVKDYQQVLTAARTALAVEKDSFAASQLKFQQGSLSQNKLLEAQDKVTEAQEKVDSAAVDLFSAYNNYRWAVDYGILN